ncbi:SDR family NAD(P)-dependent oxidoreductase [Oricola sp.]|uniref:SDR family NAD(P)-dependent oxidoreductase n=1 Tax=Oricola sp. TaxID=1979950 RepID=UPI0025FCD203|nr:SDR family NAD(P)-dependent oxidoreductase [Oricola sp.]MCI5074166.1 SDR family oxidoreductase [Oricola sp.]
MSGPLLKDKHCVITGAGGSLGSATARRFLEEGACVVLVDLDEPDLDRLGLGTYRDSALTVAADVSDAASTAAYVEAATRRFGEIDVLMSNAGNFGTVAPIDEYPLDVFESVLSVHVRGAFLACQNAVPKMRDGGSIIITSSVAGVTGDPGVYGYITAKHAQVGLMRCLAKELAPRRIRVNTLHPGPIDNSFQKNVEDGFTAATGRDGTEFFNSIIPMGRHASPDEIAASALFLASDMSTFSTGTLHMVDGGMSI